MRWYVGALVGLAVAVAALAAVVATVSIIHPKKRKSSNLKTKQDEKKKENSSEKSTSTSQILLNENAGVTQEEMATAIRNTLLKPASLLKDEIDEIEQDNQGQRRRGKRKKYYVEGVPVSIVNEMVEYMDANGNLITTSIIDYSRNNLLRLYTYYEKFRE